VHEFRDKDKTTPVVLMGYLNPIEVMGYARFAKEAAAAGVDGVLTVDLPPEEAHGFQTAMKGQGLDTIFLLAPTSPVERIKLIAKAASGFIYYVSLRGVTGAANLDVREVAATSRKSAGIPAAAGRLRHRQPETAAQVGESRPTRSLSAAPWFVHGGMAAKPIKIDRGPGLTARPREAMDHHPDADICTGLLMIG
jgi:tryptophan synthase alpha chain